MGKINETLVGKGLDTTHLGTVPDEMHPVVTGGDGPETLFQARVH